MINSIVSTRITNLRKSRGWTKKQLSIKSGVSQTYISELEAGKKNPTVVILEKLAKALDVDILELLKDKIA